MNTMTITGPDLVDLGALTDAQLVALAAAIAEEQYERALGQGDLNALLEWGFTDMFGADSKPRDPVLRNGLVVIAGSKIARSKSSHDCAWVVTGDDWIWDNEEKLAHELRTVTNGSKEVTKAISIVCPYEGQQLEIVSAKMRSGKHTATASRAFVIKNGAVTLTNARARQLTHSN